MGVGRVPETQIESSSKRGGRRSRTGAEGPTCDHHMRPVVRRGQAPQHQVPLLHEEGGTAAEAGVLNGYAGPSAHAATALPISGAARRSPTRLQAPVFERRPQGDSGCG